MFDIEEYVASRAVRVEAWKAATGGTDRQHHRGQIGSIAYDTSAAQASTNPQHHLRQIRSDMFDKSAVQSVS
jgi:hypothetical protein